MGPWRYKPAGDLGLSPRARLVSLGRETGLVAFGGRLLWRALTRTYLALYHRARIDGRENLPTAAPFILVANHANHLDAVALSAALPLRFADRIFPLAAGDTFFKSLPVSTFAAIALNALPIWRGRTTPAHLGALRDRLALDHCVYVLFPEGTRSRDGSMARFKPGLGSLVAGTVIPVVPAYIDGAFAAFPPSRRMPRPRPIVIRFGQPLVFADTPNDRAGWERIAETVEAAVRSLRSSARR